MKEALKDIKRLAKQLTSDLDQEDYIDFMRALGTWATSDTDMVESTVKMRSTMH